MFQAVAIVQTGVRTLIILIDGFVQRTTGIIEVVVRHILMNLPPLLALMTLRQADFRTQLHQVKGLCPYKYLNVLVIFFLAPLNNKSIAENLKALAIFESKIANEDTTLAP